MAAFYIFGAIMLLAELIAFVWEVMTIITRDLY